MTLRPSTAPQRVPLPSPPTSSLPAGPDPAFDSLRAARPAVTRFLATTVTDPLFESTAASALITELVEFAAACRLDYATSLVVEQEEFECFSASVPHLVSMLIALEGDPDAPDIPTPRSYAEAIEGPYSSQWQAAMDAEMASWKSTRTYVDEVPPPGANIVSGMWIFRVKRPPGSPPAFKARYVARGFSQRQGVDFFQTFSPTPKMTTLRVLLHVAAHRDYELHSRDFNTAFLQGSLHEEIWLHRPPGFTGLFPAGTQWSLRRPVYDLRQAPREWHDTLRTTLAALDDLVFATVDTEALAHVKSKLKKRHTCTDQGPSALRLHVLLATVHSQLHLRTSPTLGMGLVLGGRARVVLTGHADASWVDNLATQRSSQGYTFSLGSGSVSWWSTRSSSVLSSSCEAEIYAGAMAAQELRWLTYLLTDLGEAPRSPPVLYVDNKAMLALCQEHRLEHRTKHIAMRYFLARELQQRGQLRLAYVSFQANTADVFTKALQPCDHQPCFVFLDWSCELLMAPGQQASAKGMAVEGAEDEEEEGLEAETKMEAAAVAAMAMTTRTMDAVANGQEGRGAGGGRGRGRGGRGGRGGGAANMRNGDNESESRDDRFPGQFFFMSTQAPAGPEKDEGFEEPAAVGKVTLHSLDYWVIDSGATYSMTPRADLLTELEPSQAMFKGADGKILGLKNVLWMPNLAANLISVRRLQKACMATSSKGAKTYTARLGEWILWDLHKDRDVFNEMCKLGEHEESGAAAQKQHKDEENPKAAVEEEYGESMWGTIASAAFSNPTSAMGECDWLTLHRKMGYVALPILQQLVKNDMVAGIRVKGEPDEVLGCPTCMQANFTRFPFSSSEATAKAPLDDVVMDVVGPLKLGAAGAEYFLTIVDIYTRMTWVYVLSMKSDVVETVKTDWLPMVERQ
ncbi:unnamed protein product [Closterium sp. NIES-53]